MTVEEALNRAAALCAASECCPADILKRLQRWELNAKEQASVMGKLQSEGFLDEQRFARCFALEKIRFNKWGRRKVAQALWAKQIDQRTIDEVLNAIDPEEYLHVLRPLLKSKSRSIRANSDYEQQMKLTRFALSRGFSFNEIKACIAVPDEMNIDDED